MKIVVLLKQVPDTESVIELSDSGMTIRSGEVKWVVNPYDEYSLEEALLIREKTDNATVTVMTAGDAEADQVIRTAYALGVDHGIRIDTTGLDGLDPLAAATILSAALKKEGFDLVLAGLRAVDDDQYQVPAMVAEALDLPLVTSVLKQELEGNTIACRQQVDGGYARVTAPLPALLTTQKGINEPRYPNMRAIMKARKQPVTVWSLAEIGLDDNVFSADQARLKVVSLTYAPQRAAGLVIQGDSPAAKAEELVNLLKEATDLI